MKRKLVYYRATVIAVLLTAAAAVQAEPTRLFIQELADVAPANTVSADLEYGFLSTGVAGGLRIGAFDGEVLLNVRNTDLLGLRGTTLDGSDLATSSIGYKALIAPGIAAYGLLSYVKVDPPVLGIDSVTEIGVGVAWTLRQGALTLNVNPELLTDDSGALRGDETTLFVRGGALYALPVETPGRLSLLGEVALENSDALDTAINLGARWELREDLTIDFVLFSDQGDGGDAQGIPGAVKVNIAF